MSMRMEMTMEYMYMQTVSERPAKLSRVLLPLAHLLPSEPASAHQARMRCHWGPFDVCMNSRKSSRMSSRLFPRACPKSNCQPFLVYAKYYYPTHWNMSVH